MTDFSSFLRDCSSDDLRNLPVYMMDDEQKEQVCQEIRRRNDEAYKAMKEKILVDRENKNDYSKVS
jgi:hypothetical protein